MTAITVAKNDAGQLVGLTAADQRAFNKFWEMVGGLGEGEFFSLDVWFPRNPKLHRYHFVVIGAVFDAQERFLKQESLRAWLYVGAGHCDFLPGPDQELVAIPKSIAWSAIDDVDFLKVHQDMMEFLAGEHCRRTLWPRMSDEASEELLALLLTESESKR